MNFEDSKLSEIRQPHKENYSMILLIWCIQSNQTHRKRRENGGCQGLGWRGVGSCCSVGIEIQLCKTKNARDLCTTMCNTTTYS